MLIDIRPTSLAERIGFLEFGMCRIPEMRIGSIWKTSEIPSEPSPAESAGGGDTQFRK